MALSKEEIKLKKQQKREAKRIANENRNRAVESFYRNRNVDGMFVCIFEKKIMCKKYSFVEKI